MAWPNKVYVATQALGVYYTETFAGPSGGQPAWAAVNDGLPTLDVRQFALDPHYNAGRQYLILGTDRIIYRRELGGAWTAVLTPADVDTLLSTTGCTISRFCLDPSLPGRLWATVGSVYLFGTPNGYWAIYSDDYGDTWNATTKAYTGGYTRGLGQVRSYGDNVWFATCTGAGGSGRIRTSTDRGATWGLSDDMGFSEWTPVVHLNPFFTSKIYSRGNGYGGPDLVQMLAGTQTVLQSSLGPPRDDSMWFSASVADLQRLIKNGYIYQTDDEWETVNTPSICSPTPVSVALWSGDDEDQMILGLDLGDHVVGALASPSETTPVGLAGSSPDSSPYTDSIPNTCGGVAIGGVAAVYEGPSEGPTPPGGSTITPPDKPGESPSTPITLGGDVLTQAVTMPDYEGDARGEPLPGDRAAWDVVDHAALHARDLKDDTPVHHVPEGDASGDAPVWDGEQWVSTGVATQAELDTHEGEANPHGTELGDLADVDLTTDPPEDGEGLVWDEAGGEWVPADVTTLGDHDHSGDAGDGGTFDAANLTSGAATDGQVLTADGAGNAAWEDASGGGGGGHEILDDGTPMTQRAALDFVGFDLADDDYGDATIVTLPEGAYAETVGDGVGVTYDVVHDLATTDVVVQVWDLDATPTTLVSPSVYVVDADTVRVTFGSAPDTDQMRVVVVKGGGGGGEDVGFANPMTAAGDIITGGAGGAAGRLGIGTAGQVLKVNAGATAPEWDDESGGTHYPAYNPDEPPSVPHELDDEFDGSSLDAKWLWRNQGSATAAVGDIASCLTITGEANKWYRALVQELPSSTDWTAIAKAHWGGNFWTDSYIGIILLPGSGSGVETLALGKETTQSPTRIRIERWSDWTTWGTERTYKNYGPTHAWLRVDWDDSETKARFFVSSDGVGWAGVLDWTTLSFTPAEIGLCVRGGNLPQYFELFRFEET